MKLELVNRRDVSYVELTKEESSSLGLSVKNGSKQRRPIVKKIKPRSIAERSFSVAKGDVILSVNGQDTKWMSGKEVRRLLKEVGPLLCLKLEYEIREACLSRSGIYRKKMMTLKLKKEAHTFGFILRKKVSKHPFAMEYPVISNIVPGGPAHREGSMREGDRLLKVDDTNLSCLSLTQISKLLQAKEKAEFLIEYNIAILGDSNIQNITEVEVDVKDTNFGVLLNSSRRNSSIIYIEEIRQGSLAERCGAFSVGDIILSINGVNSDLLRINKVNSLLYQMKEPVKIAITPNKEPRGFKDRTYICTEANDSSKSTICSSSPMLINGKIIERKNRNIPIIQDSDSSLNSLSAGSRHPNTSVTQHSESSLKSWTTGSKHHNTPVIQRSGSSLITVAASDIYYTAPVNQFSGSSRNSVVSGSNNHDTPVNRRRCAQKDLTRSPKHYNTPVSHRKINSDLGCEKSLNNQIFDEQSNVISKIRNIICNVNALKLSLSSITRKAFNNVQTDRHLTNKNCDVCNTTNEAIHVCACCIMDLNTVCLQAMKSIRDLTIKFIQFETENDCDQATSSFLSDLSPLCSSNNLDEVLNMDIIQFLIDNLPEAFICESKLNTHFQSMKNKFSNAEDSCTKCKKDAFYAFLISLKLCLLLSLDEQSSEAAMTVKKLVNEFAQLVTPCTTCNNPLYDTGEINCNRNECVPSCSRTSESEVPFANLENATIGHPFEKEAHKKNDFSSRWKLPRLSFNLREKMAFYKLTDLQSETGTDITYLDDRLNQIFNVEVEAERNIPENKTSYSSLEVEVKEKNECVPKIFTEESLNNGGYENLRYLEKNVEPVGDNRCWRSVDSLISKQPPSFSYLDKLQSPKRNIPRSVANIRDTLSREQVSDNESNNADRSRSNVGFSRSEIDGCSHKNDSMNQYSTVNDVREWSVNSDSKEESTAIKFQFNDPRTSRVQAQLNRNSQKRKTHSEIMEVKLINNGKGFGFIIGMNNRSPKSSFLVPSISSIKPNSPAFQIGVLQIGDRVLAINGRRIVGTSQNELKELMSKYFAADRITLTVEFDVDEAELKSGTFKTILDKTLKAGLEYDEKRNYCPWVVNGVLRGSAAHRSGEIFPGDRILHFNCIRKDDFDPMTCGYARKEFVEFVVRRESLKEKYARKICHADQFNEPSNRKEGAGGLFENSFLKRAGECSSKRRSDALVINQEVTLYRDPTTWDFGFLAGEDPETGEAYVKDVRPGGSAHASRVIRKFDKIIAVNGVPVGKKDDCSILSLLTQANSKLHMLIQRIRNEE